MELNLSKIFGNLKEIGCKSPTVVGINRTFGSAELFGRTVVAELLQFLLLQKFCFAEHAELIYLLFIAGHHQG